MTDAAPPPLTPGTLYIVATPIGNREDITLRALRVLKECTVIAAEDTRHTGLLLKHYSISTRMVSYFQHNEAARSQEIVAMLQRGEKVALVTDAGTPGISDPGARVVRAAREAGCRVEPVPGPCALIAAICASGLPTDEFHFKGFLGHKPGQRRKELEALRQASGTVVIYESPHRIQRLMTEMAELYGDRKIVLARELTKVFEEFKSGTAAELLLTEAVTKPRGEFVVLWAPTE